MSSTASTKLDDVLTHCKETRLTNSDLCTDTELCNATAVWPSFATNSSFEIVAEECGGAGDCFFHCLSVGLCRAAEFTRDAKLIQKYSRGTKGMKSVRMDIASMINTSNALGLAEALIDGALSDGSRVQWLRKLQNVTQKTKTVTETKMCSNTTALKELQLCLRNMICTTGTYFQGTDLILRHYVSYENDRTVSDTARVARLHAWNSSSLPDIGFLVIIDSIPGICELIGGRDKPFYMVLVNYGNMHWKLGYVRECEDKLEDVDSPFYCVITRSIAMRVLNLSEQTRIDNARR